MEKLQQRFLICRKEIFLLHSHISIKQISVFSPDEEHNRIIYALKAINGIGDDVVRILLENRPYRDMQDFYERMIETKLIKNSQMMQLIKKQEFLMK